MPNEEQQSKPALFRSKPLLAVLLVLLFPLVHSYFSGGREFSPLALVFRPFRWVKPFKFYKPFQDYKHGRPESVERMKDELLAALEN